jgi:hypothetical protein
LRKAAVVVSGGGGIEEEEKKLDNRGFLRRVFSEIGDLEYA